MNNRQQKMEAFGRLLDIMDDLREKCPWDRKQTIESIRHLTIEETYELSDAILRRDMAEIRNELGDLALHLVFYARIASESAAFDIADVLHTVCEKLIRRHPHIYGDVQADDEEQVKANWEKIKLQEKKSDADRSVLSGVPVSLPALVKATRIQEKARGVGFDWEKPEQVWDKVQEELRELQDEVIRETPTSRREEELGDVLFALINYARFIGVNPEDALELTNRKFIRRFRYLEEAARQAGRELSELSLAEMDVWWNEAKAQE